MGYCDLLHWSMLKLSLYFKVNLLFSIYWSYLLPTSWIIYDLLTDMEPQSCKWSTVFVLVLKPFVKKSTWPCIQPSQQVQAPKPVTIWTTFSVCLEEVRPLQFWSAMKIAWIVIKRIASRAFWEEVDFFTWTPEVWSQFTGVHGYIPLSWKKFVKYDWN